MQRESALPIARKKGRKKDLLVWKKREREKTFNVITYVYCTFNCQYEKKEKEKKRFNVITYVLYVPSAFQRIFVATVGRWQNKKLNIDYNL